MDEGVAQGFSVESFQGHTGEKFIFRIQFFQPRVGGAGLAVGCRGHDQSMHGLDAPFAARKLGGQPIQQVRVGWSRAGVAKVVKCADDATTEMMFPDTVHHHARGEWMVRLRNPLCKGQASAGFLGFGPGRLGGVWLIGVREDCRYVRLHQGARAKVIAADERVLG